MIVYVVTISEQDMGSRFTSQCSVFTTKESAGAALDKAFHHLCNTYGVDELNEYSHYTEGESFSIDDGNCEYELFGSIDARKVDVDYYSDN